MTLAMINIFDLPGPEFLLFYLIALSLCSLVALLLTQLLRTPADLPMHLENTLSPFDIAYLKSGNAAAIRTALTSLYTRNLLHVDGMLHTFSRTAVPVPHLSLFEKSLLAEIRDAAHITTLCHLTLGDKLLRPSLIAQKLLLSPLQQLTVRLARALPFACLTIIGFIKICVGLSRNKPVEILTFLCILTVFLTLAFITHAPRTTFRGLRAIRLLKSRNSALEFSSRRKPADKTPADEALAVALFGIGVLHFGSPLALALETPQLDRSNAGGGSSCGGVSCGGGGCGGGGGGCGGCGGH